ncbi:3'(2'),5'-bisphosphate nucleotidase CysQ [Marinobacterium rhizophilum]|uniref:3'(2'),5'-bisphosphate nucleotidase CysQ n=1 Tax=Marinobacterium rhizophilum TaxID=420402 RepID=A0ABY5HKL1_9GAMM|nr:3'(2'),5'-bisphosphate nucleotidase CysQ [Marinobacterium rhizophilum]UTW12494.1 3'(2'),5'-bisphosphate nucleotidase CysQ [Marinobacterium rhizophilum]
MELTETLLDQIECIAREAAGVIMAVYQRDFGVTHKADKSPLTEADSAAHGLITARLAALTPAVPILSEEDTASFAGADAAGRYWLVDPLDGTREFIKRNGEFTVNIALIERGRAVLGVVWVPVQGLAYLGARGLGAFKQDAAGVRRPIAVAEHCSGTPWKVVGSRSHASEATARWLSRLGCCELEAIGSSLKLCLVAEGRADVYPRLGPTCLWDTAAAQAVVEQAGGAVIGLDGTALCYADTEHLLNPYFVVHGRSDMHWPSLSE